MTGLREPTGSPTAPGPGTDVLRAVEQRVLWLSAAIVHHANRVRPNPGGLKVGGHQASSASMVTIMTALWFGHLRAQDRVSVKPHASPVLHAINHLLGELGPHTTGRSCLYLKDLDTVDLEVLEKILRRSWATVSAPGFAQV